MAKLKFFYSAMGAGKSLDLLRINDNYRNLNKKCILLKPVIDTRNIGVISSRIGVEEPCITFGENDNLFDMIVYMRRECDYYCVLVDEAQFTTKAQVWQLAAVVDRIKLPVICFGLRTDYNGNTFDGSGVLLGLADELHEIVTLCHCGKKAIMELRFDLTTSTVIKDDGTNNVHIGDAEYVSTCREHWKYNDIG